MRHNDIQCGSFVKLTGQKNAEKFAEILFCRTFAGPTYLNLIC